MCVVTPSSDIVPEAHRALELLEDYHEKLTKPQDKQLRLAIERVIRIFKSRLFQALLGEYNNTFLTCACYVAYRLFILKCGDLVLRLARETGDNERLYKSN